MPGNRQVFDTAMNTADRMRWDSQWSAALQEYQKALAEFPEDATARSGLGFCYMQLKQWQDALNEYTTILQREPGSVIALSKIAELYVILNRRADAYEAYLHLADLYAQAGQGARAEAAWQRAVQLSPGDPEPHERLASYYFEKKDISQMIQERLAAAQGYLLRNEPGPARVHCEEVLRADGANTVAQQLLAQILAISPFQQLGLSEGAERTLSTQQSDDNTGQPVDGTEMPSSTETGKPSTNSVSSGNTSGGNTGIMGNMGSAGNYGGVNNPAQAGMPNGGTNAAPRKKITANQVTGALQQAQTFQNQGRFNDAIDLCEQILESGFDRPDARYFLGWLYQEQQRWDEAIQQFQHLLNDPDYALSCYYALGQCYRAHGDLRTATVHFDEAVDRVNLDALTAEESDQLVQLCQEAAEAHRLLGEQEQALTVYNALLGFLRSRGWNDKVTQVEYMLQQAQSAPVPNQPSQGPSSASNPPSQVSEAPTMEISASTLNSNQQSPANNTNNNNQPSQNDQNGQNGSAGELPDWLTGILNDGDKTQQASKPAAQQKPAPAPQPEKPATPPPAPATEQASIPSWLTDDAKPKESSPTPAPAPEPTAPAAQQPTPAPQAQPTPAPQPAAPAQPAAAQPVQAQPQSAPQPAVQPAPAPQPAAQLPPVQSSPAQQVQSQPLPQPVQQVPSQPLPVQQVPSQPLPQPVQQPQYPAQQQVPSQPLPQPYTGIPPVQPVSPVQQPQAYIAGMPPVAPVPQPQYPVQQPQYPAQQPQYPAQQPQYPAQQPQYPVQQQVPQPLTSLSPTGSEPQLIVPTQASPAAQGHQPGLEELLNQMGNTGSLGQAADAVLASTATLPESIRPQVVRSMEDIQKYINHGLLTAATEECLRVIDLAPQYLDVHQVLCEIYVKQGKTEQAITKYAILVDTYVVNGRIDDAVATYRRILQLDPNNLTYRMRLISLLSSQGNKEDLLRERTLAAESYLRLGYMDRAMTELEQALQESPTSVPTRLNYALALNKLGRTQQAVAEYQRVLQIDPRNLTALVRWHVAMITVLGTPRGTTFEQLTRIRWQLRGEGQKLAQMVHREYAQASEVYPNNADVRFALGQIYQQCGYYDRAVDEYTQATRDSHVEVFARVSAAQAYLSQGRPENAIQELEKALQEVKRAPNAIEPTIWAARPREEGEEHQAPEVEISLQLAKAYNRTGRSEQAQAMMRQVRQVRPASDEVSSSLAEISSRHTDLGGTLQEQLELVRYYRHNRQIENAVNALNEMVRMSPSDPRAHNELADIYITRGQLDEAMAELRLLADIYLRLGQLDEAGATIQRVGNMYAEMGDTEEALANLFRAAELNPESMDLLREVIGFCLQLGRNQDAAKYQGKIARYYFDTKQVKEAVAALQQLITIDPTDYNAYDMLGQTYQSVGEFEQASRVYRNLAKVNPGNSTARERLATLQELRTR